MLIFYEQMNEMFDIGCYRFVNSVKQIKLLITIGLVCNILITSEFSI